MNKADLASIKQLIVPILKESDVLSASLFGSFARGENKDESDIDLLVTLPQDKTLFDLIDLKAKLEETLSIKVDLTTPRSLSPKIKPFIQKDLVPIL